MVTKLLLVMLLNAGILTCAVPVAPECKKVKVLLAAPALLTTSCIVHESVIDETLHTFPFKDNIGDDWLTIVVPI